MNNKKTNLLAFNLIEMVVTMTIVSILAGVGITKFSQLKSPQEIINETTSLILTAINQTVYTSLNNSVSQDICNIQAGTGNNRANCSTTLTNNSWRNINNTAFNNLVTVQFTPTPPTTKFISKITYLEGLISTITYTDNSTLTINTDNENIINPITIKIILSSNLNCFNDISLYPNNVTSVGNIVTNCNI